MQTRLCQFSSCYRHFSLRNIDRLQRVQNSLARVVTRSTTISTSALNSLHWPPIRQRINYKLATLVHRSLHNACSQYLSSLIQAYTQIRQLRTASLSLLSQPHVNIALASRGFRHAGPSIWNSKSTFTLPSNPISKLTSSLQQAFLSPDNSICALLIRQSHVNFSVEII